jgi:hypothetical protein
MGYKVDRSIGGLYTTQLTTPDVKSKPMKKGKAIDGPLNGAKLEAEMHWDGKIVRWAKNKNGDDNRRHNGYHPGHYIWTGKVWRWVEDVPEILGSSKTTD